ncbi:GGDEF domain-containing protein [Massilia eurypsychrophila]|jgi:diguanylate cyclase (GGDEF)-like protein|uniref:diguanylate cyclase n=1 Tax=Massilia eurypsychrophila TaxID=1485217 RepID=A0A2G8TAD5_9BURK|nr:GGDEF domain-containing protein [Massilia eurypsychrophila]PIL42939.1 GGDEF domain-containing protein [Massilia eurypsychrophila]
MDITTMVFALALGNLSLCAALFFFEYERKKSLTLSTWSVAKQCQAAAWLLLYFRGSGVVPDPISIPLGYSILFVGVALEAGAMWEAAERTRWRRPTLWLLILAIGVFIACYIIDETGLRTVASSLILGAFYLSGAAALALGWRDATMLRRFVAIATALLALLVAARGVMVLTMPGGWGWISNTILQLWSSAAFYLLMLGNGFGYLLLTREQVQSEIERLAVVDALTDCPNRRGFFIALAPWLSLARRPGLPTALVLFELDQFKRVNDSYGHPAGDNVLRAVVEVCKRHMRDSDQLGRMVGVEFAILLPRTALPEAALVAERMRIAIESSPVKGERAMIGMTASFGVTTIRADDTTVSLFKRADDALQAAKAGGRNRVVEAHAVSAAP